MILLAPLISGGFWYIRNAVLTGNPFYPLEVRVLGRSDLARLVSSRGDEKQSVLSCRSRIGGLSAISLLVVLDPRLTPLWISCLLIAGWAAQKPDNPTVPRRQSRCSRSWPVLNVVLYWVFIPYRTQQRFMLQAVGARGGSAGDHSRSFPLATLRGVLLLALHLLTPQRGHSRAVRRRSLGPLAEDTQCPGRPTVDDLEDRDGSQA